MSDSYRTPAELAELDEIVAEISRERAIAPGLAKRPPPRNGETTMSRSRGIGTTAETAVVRYLRTRGFDHAERRALTGAHDQGDITGTPGLCWEIKSGRAAETASDGLIQDWIDETESERLNARADIGILVTKRPGYGPCTAAGTCPAGPGCPGCSCPCTATGTCPRGWAVHG